MKHRINTIAILFSCVSISLLNIGLINSAYAEQKKSMEMQAVPNSIRGKVTEVIKASGYTYAEVDTGKNKIWAAGPVTPLKVGDSVVFSSNMLMKNFYSKAMKRNFPTIYFVSSFSGEPVQTSQTSKATSAAPPHGQFKHKPVVKKSIKGISKIEDGNTIAEIYAQKQEFKGKEVRVRGQVTKFTADVMGKNWLHIRDSSTLDDLTVTTDNTAVVDDIVVIEGKLELDKDYSYGYVYPVIIENAGITKE